jgi:hypothetical protein
MALLSPFEKIPLQTTANLREDYQVFVSEKWVFAQPLKPASARGLLRLHKDLLSHPSGFRFKHFLMR